MTGPMGFTHVEPLLDDLYAGRVFPNAAEARPFASGGLVYALFPVDEETDLTDTVERATKAFYIEQQKCIYPGQDCIAWEDFIRQQPIAAHQLREVMLPVVIAVLNLEVSDGVE